MKRRTQLRTAVGGAILVALVIAGLRSWRASSGPAKLTETATQGSVPSPGPPRTAAGAPAASAPTYVGSADCVDCHADQYRSYRRTAHSLALAEIDVSEEPPDAAFYHEASGRAYRIYRSGSELRHRESVLDDEGNDIAATDHAVRYLIGSGRHSRSYLVDIDGFLCESPLTWYASRQEWGMSPGYDSPNHRGFERAAESGCLFCHVGRVAEGDRSYQKLTILEQPIGCERCHGPGSLHVAQERAAGDLSHAPAVGPPTIVNPARLSRKLSEAVCAQCHLNTDAMALVAGKGLDDFRPGTPLTAVCINYSRKKPNSQMTVVGHIEQMQLSRCYQQSETLTCTTCHDPHSDMEDSQKKTHVIQVCRSCHTDQSCKGTSASPMPPHGEHDCVKCHMPQVDTDIRHIAFTHHRIGIHDEVSSGDKNTAKGDVVHSDDDAYRELVELVPLDDVPDRPRIERQRNLGLAYFSLSLKQENPLLASAYRERARELLEFVRAQGAGHREVAAALVRIYHDSDAETSLGLAKEALASGHLDIKSEINCLFFIGEWGVQRGQPAAARQVLERLTKMRYLSDDWRLLGLACWQTGDFAASRASLERAAAIAPLRPDVRMELAAVYEKLGETDAASRQRRTASQLVAQLKKRD